MPAGNYALYSIPEADGGTLILSTHTRRPGLPYHEGEDLGRVPLTRSALDESVEVFTINVVESDTGGVLRLEWDRTAFSVPFTVVSGSP